MSILGDFGEVVRMTNPPPRTSRSGVFSCSFRVLRVFRGSVLDFVRVISCEFVVPVFSAEELKPRTNTKTHQEERTTKHTKHTKGTRNRRNHNRDQPTSVFA